MIATKRLLAALGGAGDGFELAGLLFFGADEALEEGAIDGLLFGPCEAERRRRQAGSEREGTGERGPVRYGHPVSLNPSEADANGGPPKQALG